MEGFEGASRHTWVSVWGQGWEHKGGSGGWVCLHPSLDLHVTSGVKQSLGKGWESPGRTRGVLETGNCLVSHFGAPSIGLQGWGSVLADAKHPWSCQFSLAQFGFALPGLADTHPGGCQAVPAPYTSSASTPGPQGCHLQWQTQEVACHFLDQATLLVALGSPKGRVASCWPQQGPLCLAACEMGSREGFLV